MPQVLLAKNVPILLEENVILVLQAVAILAGLNGMYQVAVAEVAGMILEMDVMFVAQVAVQNAKILLFCYRVVDVWNVQV